VSSILQGEAHSSSTKKIYIYIYILKKKKSPQAKRKIKLRKIFVRESKNGKMVEFLDMSLL
jgi:hypothetical protein